MLPRDPLLKYTKGHSGGSTEDEQRFPKRPRLTPACLDQQLTFEWSSGFRGKCPCSARSVQCMCNFTAIAMATFTFRIPDSVTGRLSSAQMRSWLADFLRQPHALPADPGSGEERISLTLPKEAVSDAASLLRCSPSCALRRVAAERLRISAAVVQKTASAHPRTRLNGTLRTSQVPARPLAVNSGIGNPLNVAYARPQSIARPQPALGILPQRGRRIWPPEPFRPVHLEALPARIPGAGSQRISASALLLSIIPGVVLLVLLFFVFRQVRENAIAA